MNEYEDYLTNLTEFVIKQINYSHCQWRGATPASQPQESLAGMDPESKFKVHNMINVGFIKAKNKL